MLIRVNLLQEEDNTLLDHLPGRDILPALVGDGSEVFGRERGRGGQLSRQGDPLLAGAGVLGEVHGREMSRLLAMEKKMYAEMSAVYDPDSSAGERKWITEGRQLFL